MNSTISKNNQGQFPTTRMRRNRLKPFSRQLLAENHLLVSDLIWPVFVTEGHNVRQPISSMPNVHRFSIDQLITEISQAYKLGIQAIALFPHIENTLKDANGTNAYQADNLITRAVRAIKQAVPDIGIICDVALDPFTDHGHDGIMINDTVDNDASVEALCKQALNQAQAGCDIVAPSDMMDGRVAAIRKTLDTHGFQHVQILAYAAKYASCFYGPFRDALGSNNMLKKTSKASYQMNPANAREALREVALDIAEGADMVMIKPGMPYLDIVHQVKQNFQVPTFVYQVSGEYAMIMAAHNQGWIDGPKAAFEALLCMKRAGADAILTYFAVDIAKQF